MEIRRFFKGKNDKYSIEIYQKQINDKVIVNKNGLIYNPKYYGIDDLKEIVYNGERPRPRVVENFLFGNNIVCRRKDNKHKYDLSEEFKNNGDIFLNNEPVYKIRFTEKGLEMMKDLYNRDKI